MSLRNTALAHRDAGVVLARDLRALPDSERQSVLAVAMSGPHVECVPWGRGACLE